MTKPRRKARAATYHNDNNVFAMRGYAEDQKIQNKKVYLKPKSEKQAEYIDVLTDWEKQLVLTTGPAGTGKSYLAVLAGIKALKEKDIQKLIITRPAVGADDEKHGFLPGTIDEKMAPWVRPLFDVMQEYYTVRELIEMRDEQIIELSPLAFMRGRSFSNSWIIFDEAQNSSINQMKMVLTRIGEGSNMVVTGDMNQTDKAFMNNNGLKDFASRLVHSRSNSIALVNFDTTDIQRSSLCREVLNLYGEE